MNIISHKQNFRVTCWPIISIFPVKQIFWQLKRGNIKKKGVKKERILCIKVFCLWKSPQVRGKRAKAIKYYSPSVTDQWWFLQAEDLCTSVLCMFRLGFLRVFALFCVCVCVFVYGPFCRGCLILGMSTMFTTLFLWTFLQFILVL